MEATVAKQVEAALEYIAWTCLLYTSGMLMEKGWIELIKSRHAAIIRAIEEKNPEEAGETLKTHLLETAEVMRRTHPELITDIPSPYWKMNN